MKPSKFLILFAGLCWITTALGQTKADSPVPAVAVQSANATQPKSVIQPHEGERNEYQRETVALLVAGDFDPLESRVQKALDEKQRFKNGEPKLHHFYIGLADLDKAAPETAWRERLKHLEAWVSARPESSTALLALARFWVRFGWKARGTSYADKVTDDGWKLFSERLQVALSTLEKAAGARARDPHYWRIAHQIGLGLNWPREAMDKIYEQSLALDPSDWTIVPGRAYMLLPRWTGKPGEMEAFALEATKLSSGIGEEIYGRIGWHMEDVFKNVFDETQLEWERVKAAYRVILQRYPGDTELLSQFCMLACRARDRATARECLAQLDGVMDLRAFGSEDRYRRHIRWAMHSE